MTRRFIRFALATVALGFAGSALAQSYPSRPIRIIAPFSPGSAADILARLIGPKMTERMGQPFIVDNRPGANGLIGMELLARARPDGYTIGIGQGGNMVVAPHTYRKLPYDPLKDFAPVALLGTNYLAVVANPKAPFNSAAEMIAWAKNNPGKLSVASSGEGGFSHLAFEQLRLMAGFQYTHVPYKSSVQFVSDLVGGQIHVAISAYTVLSPHLQSGRVRLVAVTNPVRVPNKPELPIFAEVVPGYESRGWFGYIAPAATPREIITRLNEEINRALKQPEIGEKMAAEGLILVTEPPRYFGKLIHSDFSKYGKLVRDIGFQPQ